jgi:hypothetical protein
VSLKKTALTLAPSLDSSFLVYESITESLELVHGLLSYVPVLSKQRVVVLAVLVLVKLSAAELAP